VRKNSHSLSLQAFLTHSLTLALTCRSNKDRMDENETSVTNSTSYSL